MPFQLRSTSQARIWRTMVEDGDLGQVSRSGRGQDHEQLDVVIRSHELVVPRAVAISSMASASPGLSLRPCSRCAAATLFARTRTKRRWPSSSSFVALPSSSVTAPSDVL